MHPGGIEDLDAADRRRLRHKIAVQPGIDLAQGHLCEIEGDCGTQTFHE
jgi:hypothetical protein